MKLELIGVEANKRTNKEIIRRAASSGSSSTHAALIRLAGAVLGDRYDEWQAGERRCLCVSDGAALAARRVREHGGSVGSHSFPTSAVWLHRDARSGFEVAFFEPLGDGYVLSGATTAVEDGQPWVVEYEIQVDGGWRTRMVQLKGRSELGSCVRTLETDGTGRWWVDDVNEPMLEGCLDVDLESSALTNALPGRRLGLAVGVSAPAPAAYVRALGLRVERLDQEYTRLSDRGERQVYDYAAPAFDFSCQLEYDAAGLVLVYPGIAVRLA